MIRQLLFDATFTFLSAQRAGRERISTLAQQCQERRLEDVEDEGRISAPNILHPQSVV